MKVLLLPKIAVLLLCLNISTTEGEIPRVGLYMVDPLIEQYMIHAIHLFQMIVTP